DGTTNSTLPSLTFTYTNAGNFNVQLIVTDSQGNRAVANVPITAGNNKPVVSILQPPNGAIFDWGKALAYQLSVSDVEDGSTTNGSYISLFPVNLTNITGITFRVASSGLGGRIETHVDSPGGTLISTANVPFTGGVYTNISVPITDPHGTHTLYFVFLRNPGDANLLVLNWLEFQGPGLSFSSTPYGGAAHSLPDTVQAEDFDNGGEGVGYHDTEPANFGGA